MKKLIVLAALCLSFTGFYLTRPAVYADAAADVCAGIGVAVANGGGCDETNGGTTKSVGDVITSAVNFLSIIVGIIGTIMVIVGGFKYITSGGNDKGVSSAKSTITYALIGLVVAALAQVLVHFVLYRVTTTPSPAAPTGNSRPGGSGGP